VLFDHLRDQLNPDAVAYGHTAELWLRGDVGLALNATWGVLCSWLAVPGLLLGLEPPDAMRAGQVAAALIATAGAYAVFGCFALRRVARGLLTLAVSVHAAAASTIVVASDAAFVAVVVWTSWAVLTRRERILGLPRPLVAGVLAGVCALARPIGLPVGIAFVAFGEILRATEGERGRVRWALGLALSGWALVAVPWIGVLSAHYGRFTTTHSGRLVHDAVGPHTGHPWNLPSFTRLHRPPLGRITTWEDPSTEIDASLAWSPFESTAAWAHQVRLCRENLRAIAASLVRVDRDGLALASLLVLPLLAMTKPRPGVGWREAWLFVCVGSYVAALVPLHVEDRYLWPVLPLMLAGLGSLAARAEVALGAAGGRASMRVVAAIVSFLMLGPPVAQAALGTTALLLTPARRERRLVRDWQEKLRRAQASGPVVSWSPYPEKALDPEGLYLAWRLGEPWLGNLGGDGRDAPRAIALGARVLVAKVDPDGSTPLPFGAPWRVLTTADVRGSTLRDGRYVVLVQP
jgi:hypothetical protein